MFRFLGTAIHYTWTLWLVGWVALCVFLHLTAPPWTEVAQDREFGFLPTMHRLDKGRRFLEKPFRAIIR